jgi:cell wall-associated NlpC family hydrolase
MSRFATTAKRPMNISIAAGVAGTVAVTGTVVATASDHSVSPRTTSVAFTNTDAGVASAAAQLQRQETAALARQDQRMAAIKAAHREAVARHKAAARRAARAAHRAAEQTASRSATRVDEHMSASAAHVLEIAAAQSGDSYSYGAAGPDAFDCSGFTQYVFGHVGISLPHSAAGQATVATPVSQPQPGDLVFVHNGSGGSIGHVAIYAGGGYWYEASNPSQPVGKHPAWSSNVTFGRVL